MINKPINLMLIAIQPVNWLLSTWLGTYFADQFNVGSRSLSATLFMLTAFTQLALLTAILLLKSKLPKKIVDGFFLIALLFIGLLTVSAAGEIHILLVAWYIGVCIITALWWNEYLKAGGVAIP